MYAVSIYQISKNYILFLKMQNFIVVIMSLSSAYFKTQGFYFDTVYHKF